MANSEQLLQRNKDFAATCAHEEASIIARHQVYVITCLDRSFTLPGEVLAWREAAPPPGPSRAEVPRSLA